MLIMNIIVDVILKDRFAEARSLPPIDPSQDWFLLNSEEENGFTILEFSRNFTTCDDRDLDITVCIIIMTCLVISMVTDFRHLLIVWYGALV